MREILFRGKRIDNGEWTEGYLFVIWESAYIVWGTTNGVPNMVQVDPSTVEAKAVDFCERMKRNL